MIKILERLKIIVNKYMADLDLPVRTGTGHKSTTRCIWESVMFCWGGGCFGVPVDRYLGCEAQGIRTLSKGKNDKKIRKVKKYS
jgi:hypothetical protein